MELWQLDIVGGIRLADGGEAKVVTGVDDHSRFCVIATVVRRATGRAVCAAFGEALQRFGIPEEVLTDNGKQFTGRFNQPRPAEVMFERICRENGVVARNTKPRTPTTTGKIERFHQSLRELLDDVEVWPDVEAVQAAIDEFRGEYNTSRPHQSLDMEFPADRFTPRPADTQLPLRLPTTLTAVPVSAPRPAPPIENQSPGAAEPAGPARAVRQRRRRGQPRRRANPGGARVRKPDGVRATVLAPPGPRWQPGQALGRHYRRAPHHNGVRLKTVPSRLTITQLQQLLAEDGHPAGPPPIQTGPVQFGGAIEVDRLVKASGLVALAGRQHPIGYQFAGQRVSIRIDGRLMQIISANGVLLRSLPNPLTPADHIRIRDARPAGPPPRPSTEPVRVQRRVSCRGALVVAGQRIHVGMVHAGRTVTVEAADHTFRVYDGDEQLTEVARTTLKPIGRFKVRKPEPRRHPDRTP